MFYLFKVTHSNSLICGYYIHCSFYFIYGLKSPVYGLILVYLKHFFFSISFLKIIIHLVILKRCFHFACTF